ncbi:hypothetical protein BK121_15870 [Paenibacillus odorifer]|uniref:DsbA family protein n=1 Tax=Paenibacillus odorifer TaxID=189426 RepID=UPI00096DC3E7|nr:DsbA family protein [Paenibacillus odorifer]OMC70061.1 hypothetical protein BK121_15870 [Paenibacillus odorifer]
MKIEIIAFTDPFCVWCWASEPITYQLKERYREQIQFKYVMGGLTKDMSAFYDAQNQIGSTAQVAPHWRLVSEKTGQPSDERVMLDITDPNFSTWPSNIAVKAAQMQGSSIGDDYLRRLRRAVHTERKKIQEHDVYIQLADDIPGLDVEQFKRDLDSGAAEKLFEKDLRICRIYGVTGFPTVAIRLLDALAGDNSDTLLLNGYRPYDTYLQVFSRLGADLVEYEPRSVRELLTDYGPLTTKELASIYNRDLADMETDLLNQSADLGLTQTDVNGHGRVWDLEQI